MFARNLQMTLESKIKAAIRDVSDFPKPGIVFKDITPIFENQDLCNQIINAFIDQMNAKPDAIVGIESRGFLFGFLLANKLNVPFILVRKAGKLPYKTVSLEYDLEYGSAKIEMHEDSIKPNWNVLIHDDLLATGGTAAAAAELIKKQGANIFGFNFVIELEFLQGKEKINQLSNNITCLALY
jgi:adenine phosphoribosyltransferase